MQEKEGQEAACGRNAHVPVSSRSECTSTNGQVIRSFFELLVSIDLNSSASLSIAGRSSVPRSPLNLRARVESFRGRPAFRVSFAGANSPNSDKISFQLHSGTSPVTSQLYW